MAWNDNLTALNYVLAGLYPFPKESYRIVVESDIPPQQVAFRDKAIDTWFEILHVADIRGKVTNVIRAALKDHPENSVLIQAEKGELSQAKAPTIDKDLKWKGDLSPDTLEKIMGKQSTFLPVSFLETGLKRARAVARIRLSNGELGTGFLIKDNLLVTNNHVMPNSGLALGAEIQFNYQQAASGRDLEPTILHLDPDRGFKTSVEDDWTFIRVKEDANADWGAIEVEEVDVSKTERVNIIQHPSGGPKQIAIYHNVVAYVDDKQVQYLTDTLPGSSGSPVFDSRWQIVALHHSGGWILEPQTKNPVFRNEGININRIVEGLKQADL
ncbi:MAG TPA: trypsin-like peptidase domain-containing protein [Blastocatellia bacterium]|jgi:V8-like Glu-specific endopeptidase|nr:trypsin-like peptidase domain-containing protein [Blastocatellia bacterium]